MLLVIILLFTISSPSNSEHCTASEDQQKSILQNIKMELTDQSIITQPWSFIALRLGIEQDLEMEQTLLHKLREAAVKKIETGDHFPMDLTAFYVLALRAWCQTAVQITATAAGKKEVNLVERLRQSLSTEMHEQLKRTSSNEHVGGALKRFQEVSLAMLALCQEDEYIHRFIIQTFAAVYLRQIAQHRKELTVDVMSTTALTLRCLIQSQRPRGWSRLQIAKTLMQLMRWILKEVREDGTIGSLDSTGLAMQALRENINVYTSRVYSCSQTVQKMVSEFRQGNFGNLRMLSDAAIALGGRSYLDVNKVACPLHKVSPLTTANSNISSFTTPSGAQDPVITNSKVLNENIQPLPNATLSQVVSPSTFHSGPTDTSPSLAPTLLIASTGQLPHILPSPTTSAPYPATASPTNQNPLDAKSGKESFVVDATFPLVMTEAWSTVPGERAEMVSNENGEVGASDTATITPHETATIISGESLDTWPSWDAPLVRGKVAPIVGTETPQIVNNQTSLLINSELVTIVTGKPGNKTAPVLTTLRAREANEKTVLLEDKVGGSPVTEDTTPIPENGMPSVITRDTPSLTRNETGFNVRGEPTVNESVTKTMGRSNKTAV